MRLHLERWLGAALLFSASLAAQEASSPAGVVMSRDRVPIAYEVHGTGSPGAPALIFVHGWSCDRSYWKEQLSSFSPDFQVVAVDLAGHGESGLGRRKWTIAAFGDDVASVVKKLGLHRVILIGHSMGGDVIPEAARELRGRVVGLIWVDVYKKLGPGRTPESVKALVDMFRPDFRDTTRAFVRTMFLPTSDSVLRERIAEDMSSAPPEVAIPSMEASFNNSRQITRALDALKLRTIAINPDNAPSDEPSLRAHGVEVMYMTGVDHFMFLEDPPRFDGILREAIGRLTR